MGASSASCLTIHDLDHGISCYHQHTQYANVKLLLLAQEGRKWRHALVCKL